MNTNAAAPAQQKQQQDVSEYAKRPALLAGTCWLSPDLLERIPATARTTYHLIQHCTGADGEMRATVTDLMALSTTVRNDFVVKPLQRTSLVVGLRWLTRIGLVKMLGRAAQVFGPGIRKVRGLLLTADIPRDEWTVPKDVLAALKRQPKIQHGGARKGAGRPPAKKGGGGKKAKA